MSIDEPSIKGFIVQTAVEDLRKRLAEENPSASQLRLLALTEADREQVDQEIIAGLWYPIAFHDRVLRTLADLSDADSPSEFLTGWSIHHAEKMMQGPLKTMVDGARGFSNEGASKVLIKLPTLAFNFTKWEYQGPELDDFTITVSEATHFPDSVRYTNAGMMQVLATIFAETQMVVKSTRERLDLIRYRAKRA